jgi:hypothetical protein
MTTNENTITQRVDLSRFAPVMAESPAPTVSKSYAFVPTSRVVNLLTAEGWLPESVQMTRPRSIERQGYQRHVIRFNRAEDSLRKLTPGETIPQLVLSNDHTGGGAFTFLAGIFEVICSNRATVSDATLGAFKVSHRGFADFLVTDSVKKYLEYLPDVMETVRAWKGMELTRSRQLEYSRAAVEMRFDGERWKSQLDELTESALWVTHEQHWAPTLWNTFQTVQGNLIRGGIPYWSASRFRLTSRPIKAPKADIDLNRKLWDLARQVEERAL